MTRDKSKVYQSLVDANVKINNSARILEVQKKKEVQQGSKRGSARVAAVWESKRDVREAFLLYLGHLTYVSGYFAYVYGGALAEL